MSSTYVVNLETRILDKMLYVVNSDIPLQLLQSILSSTLEIGTVMGSLYSCGSPFIFQIELKSLWISEHNVLPPAWICSTRILSVPGDLCTFSYSIVISTSKELVSGTKWLSCMYLSA
jgi:hypothetical protein